MRRDTFGMSFAMEPVMSWLNPFRASSAGREPATHPKPPVRVDAVRSVMLGHASLVPEACGLRARILRAHDAQGLWYLRPELMTTLAGRLGEGRARQLVDSLDPLFCDAGSAVPDPTSRASSRCPS